MHNLSRAIAKESAAATLHEASGRYSHQGIGRALATNTSVGRHAQDPPGRCPGEVQTGVGRVQLLDTMVGVPCTRYRRLRGCYSLSYKSTAPSSCLWARSS